MRARIPIEPAPTSLMLDIAASWLGNPAKERPQQQASKYERSLPPRGSRTVDEPNAVRQDVDRLSRGPQKPQQQPAAQRLCGGRHVADHADHADWCNRFVRQWIIVTPGQNPVRRTRCNPMHTDLIAVAKYRNVSDRGLNSAVNGYRLAWRDRRKHTRSAKRRYELAPLSFPKHSNGIDLVR
jgi:hypothetical protein